MNFRFYLYIHCKIACLMTNTHIIVSFAKVACLMPNTHIIFSFPKIACHYQTHTFLFARSSGEGEWKLLITIILVKLSGNRSAMFWQHRISKAVIETVNFNIKWNDNSYSLLYDWLMPIMQLNFNQLPSEIMTLTIMTD